MTDQAVSRTIYSQLGGNKFAVMTGARNFVNHGDALSFKLSGTMTKNKSNYVKISLTAMDLYKVQFGKIRKYKYKILKEIDGVYYDQLVSIFESETGLNTRL